MIAVAGPVTNRLRFPGVGSRHAASIHHRFVRTLSALGPEFKYRGASRGAHTGGRLWVRG